MLDQVGEFESSKSAMKVLAPELRALMTILRSVGPVISTRRSSRPGPGVAQRHETALRMAAVSGRNPRGLP
jgi:hypothetical protein